MGLHTQHWSARLFERSPHQINQAMPFRELPVITLFYVVEEL